MGSADVMDHYSLDGLNVMAVRVREMESFLNPRIADDLSYLVD